MKSFHAADSQDQSFCLTPILCLLPSITLFCREVNQAYRQVHESSGIWLRHVLCLFAWLCTSQESCWSLPFLNRLQLRSRTWLQQSLLNLMWDYLWRLGNLSSADRCFSWFKCTSSLLHTLSNIRIRTKQCFTDILLLVREHPNPAPTQPQGYGHGPP